MTKPKRFIAVSKDTWIPSRPWIVTMDGRTLTSVSFRTQREALAYAILVDKAFNG